MSSPESGETPSINQREVNINKEKKYNKNEGRRQKV
jgi:hypothetical protein